MTYEQVLEAIKRSGNNFYGYALDNTGWYLFILDSHDDTFPEPQAYDIMLDEYRDAPDIPERGRRQTGWWTSIVDPKETIRQGKWEPSANIPKTYEGALPPTPEEMAL